jgi:hypothetical protein
VTGYIRLDLLNRSHAEYERLGRQLVGAAEAAGHLVNVFGGKVDDCWHYHLSAGAELPLGNPGKDSRQFLAVQHQKTAWVADAATITDADVLVWMDYGLLHVPGITAGMVPAFLERAAASAPRDRVGMASIWGPPRRIPDWRSVEWWCAGGVFTVPRSMAFAWHDAVVDRAVAMRAAGHVTWEVNTWATAWARCSNVVQPWLCDHNETILEAGP